MVVNGICKLAGLSKKTYFNDLGALRQADMEGASHLSGPGIPQNLGLISVFLRLIAPGEFAFRATVFLFLINQKVNPCEKNIYFMLWFPLGHYIAFVSVKTKMQSWLPEHRLTKLWLL